MKHPLMTLAIFLVFGILLGQRLPLSPGWISLCLLPCIVAGAAAYRTSSRLVGYAACLGAVLVLGAIRFQLASPALDPLHYRNAWAPGPGRFEVLVVDAPVTLDGTVSVPVELRAAHVEGRRQPIRGRAMMRVAIPTSEGTTLAYGDVVEVLGHLGASTRSSGRMDPAVEVFEPGPVCDVLSVSETIRVMTRSSGGLVRSLLLDLRGRIAVMLDQTHPPEVSGFIRAILLGQRDGTSDSFNEYRRTGTYHLLAVSGSHVSLMAMILFGLLSSLGLGRRVSGPAVIVMLLPYVLMVGANPSVLRAWLMGAVVLAGHSMERPLSLHTSLSCASLVVLVLDPAALFTASFQLSFLAILSIAYLTPPLMSALDFLPPFINSLVATSLAASLGTAPILAIQFGEIPLVGPLANALAIPLFGIILPVAFMGVVGSTVSLWVPFFFGAANYGFVTLLSRLLHLLSSIPGATVDVSTWPPSLWVPYSLGLVVLGDYQTVREQVSRWLRLEEAPAAVDPIEIDPAKLERATRELDCLLPTAEDATDPIGSRLAQIREAIRAQTSDLAPEFLLRFDALRQETWTYRLDGLTIAYLALGEAWLVTGRGPDKLPSLLLFLRAVEHELYTHLFHPMRQAPGVGRCHNLLGRFPNNPILMFLTSPPRPLALEEQNELIWAMVTTHDRPLRNLVKGMQRAVAATVAIPEFFLDSSRLPLRLDQIYKRLYRRLDRDTWDWETVSRAREELLGRPDSLMVLIGRALGTGEPLEQVVGESFGVGGGPAGRASLSTPLVPPGLESPSDDDLDPSETDGASSEGPADGPSRLDATRAVPGPESTTRASAGGRGPVDAQSVDSKISAAGGTGPEGPDRATGT